ncbi:MAG: 6-bladed beta-propeller [Bacteroidales bacterium]
MKNLILSSLFLLSFISCQQKKKDVFVANLKPTELQDTSSFVLCNNNVQKVKIEEPSNANLKMSDIIEEFKYIPIETADSSLLGQYKTAYLFEDKIILEDVETNMAYIFNDQGKYIHKIGRKGYGPGEMIKLSGLAVDLYNRNLVAYDQFFNKLFYYTLDGSFLFTREMPLNSSQNIQFVAPDLIAFAVNQTRENEQLENLNQCNVLFTDSMLNVLGGTYHAAKNFSPNYSPYSFSQNRAVTGYTPPYEPDFYQFSGDTLVHTYHFEYKGFDKLFVLNNAEKNSDDGISLFYSTRLLPPVLFTNRFLWFKTQMPQAANEFYTLYDKISEKSISFKPSDLVYDIPFRFTSVLTSYKDYLVGYVGAPELIEMKKAYDRSGVKIDPEIEDMINDLQTDDNDILVLFKLKNIQ